MGELAPHTRPVSAAASPGGGTFTALDHLAIRVDPANCPAIADCYIHAFRMSWQPMTRTVTSRQAMDSRYLRAGDSAITVVVYDPTREPGQITAFLKEHVGPGRIARRRITRRHRRLRAGSVRSEGRPDGLE